MTGTLPIMTEFKKRKIRQLTGEGLSAAVIAERLGIDVCRVYYWRKPRRIKEENK